MNSCLSAVSNLDNRACLSQTDRTQLNGYKNFQQMNENETPRQIDKRTSVEKQETKKQRPETSRIVKSSCGRVCWVFFVCVCVCDVEMMMYLEAARCIIWGYCAHVSFT